MGKQYFNICELCGATLDPNEKCTCVEEAKEKQEQAEIENKVSAFLKMLSYGKGGRRNEKARNKR